MFGHESRLQKDSLAVFKNYLQEDSLAVSQDYLQEDSLAVSQDYLQEESLAVFQDYIQEDSLAVYQDYLQEDSLAVSQDYLQKILWLFLKTTFKILSDWFSRLHSRRFSGCFSRQPECSFFRIDIDNKSNCIVISILIHS